MLDVMKCIDFPSPALLFCTVLDLPSTLNISRPVDLELLPNYALYVRKGMDFTTLKSNLNEDR